MTKHSKKGHKHNYGIYTVGDGNFFAGIVASINALRFYGYTGPIAAIDIGYDDWMRDYLASFEGVQVLDMEPIAQIIRFTDVLSDESPVLKGWAYKAFGITYYDLFKKWTFIDGDYFAMCNLETELLPLIDEGLFVSTEDGINQWNEKHEEAIGVKPGSYMNINAGFISLDMGVYAPIIHEWRNVMTRRKPFDLWYGDQGALNAVLDKYGVEKFTIDKVLWNQTLINTELVRENKCQFVEDAKNPRVWYEPKQAKIMGWHGVHWYKLWHQIGIDHYRKNDEAERQRFFLESQGRAPAGIVKLYERFLFFDGFNRPLKRDKHLLVPPA